LQKSIGLNRTRVFGFGDFDKHFHQLLKTDFGQLFARDTTLKMTNKPNMNDVLPKNVNIPTRMFARDGSSKRCIRATTRNGNILDNEHRHPTPSSWAQTVLNSLPGRRGLANTSNGWTSVEVKIDGEWQALDVHRKRFLNRPPMTNVELHMLSF
jgi:hypothetical protein